MSELSETTPVSQDQPREARYSWIWDVLLVLVLLIGAYFRFSGVNWDEGTHMHPDERFMTMVGSALSPVKSLGDYFDTEKSTLNPNNVGYGFYVYGTLPLFIVRYVAEAFKMAGYGEIALVGRQLSALFDLATAFIVFLITLRLFRKPPVAVLAAAFYALSVLPIQLSHFYKEDTFLAFFAALTVYFAVRIVPWDASDREDLKAGRFGGGWSGVVNYLMFGLSFGMAISSKISIAPLAALLPAAALVRWYFLAPEERDRYVMLLLRNLVLAGFVALLAFRIFQPYAFSGPGFFGLTPNPRWIANMREIANQNSGDVDFPPQLQWARRTPFFSFENMVVWGFGLPLGLLAWAAFVWMGWRIFRGKWQERSRLILLWGWTGAYFAWQAASITRTMRYQMPVYPTLAVIAAWGVYALWQGAQTRRWLKPAALVVGAGVLVCTLGWAFAFTRIYTRTFSRVEASRWIYQNVPGPVNLRVATADGEVNQPISFTHGLTLTGNTPLYIAFTSKESGRLTELSFAHLLDISSNPQARISMKELLVTVTPQASPDNPIGYAVLNDVFTSGGDGQGQAFAAKFIQAAEIEAGKTYYFNLNLQTSSANLEISGPLLYSMKTAAEVVRQALPEPESSISQGQAMSINFAALNAGPVKRIFLDRIVDLEANPATKKLHLTLNSVVNSKIIGSADFEGTFMPGQDPRGEGVWIELNSPVQLEKDKPYNLSLQFFDGPGRVSVYGSKHANETSWDDALPLGIDGYDPYSYGNGIYRTDLNFEMYQDDNAEKLDRFLTNLEQLDYVFISSNRQWGTTVRVPERYPLTTLYYRNLLGCPIDKEITWCYAVAAPGIFQSQLGFELVYIDQNDPNLGPIRFNSQFAEEAFTVYDNPKVLIFKKTAAYDAKKVRAMFNTVDLNKVVHLTPNKAGSYPGNLILSAVAQARQQAGGTWSELFDVNAIQNRYPGVGVVIWYLAISLLGWLVLPIVRAALRGLPDRGYPFARMVGMLLLAYPTWLLGSYNVAFSRTTIVLVLAGLVLVSAVLGWLQRKEMIAELKRNWRYILLVEVIGLAFFALFLLVRLGNSDLWHPYKGGEKPMDFSYFNAVLKSTIFPPYDPWFAGGYINYYYYGFVIVGVPVKLLGIVPSIAYNLILPQLFSLLALGGFSVAWNVLVSVRRESGVEKPTRPYGAGVVAAVFLVILGNLGTLRMIWEGLMKLSAPGGVFDTGNIIQKIGWTFSGIAMYASGATLPYPPGDWYWIPSRALPASSGDPITEFPAFTFLYADLHAHMIALPVTVLALAWALSLVLGKWHWADDEGKWGWLHFAASFGLGGLAIGTLRPTNTWDFPTYLALGAIAVIYAVMRHADLSGLLANVPEWMKRLVLAAVCAAGLSGLALLLYQPYAQMYGQAYNSIAPWENGHTPTDAYLTHWGLFLFMIVSFLLLETVDWMATTPLSALSKFKPHRSILFFLFGLLAAAVGLLLFNQIWIGWMVLPLMTWAGVLLLRPGMPVAKRAVLFMIGTGLVLTLMVEIIVLVGDINRMNTVFKFYLQAWTLLGLSAAIGLAWAYDDAVYLLAKQTWGSALRMLWYAVAAAVIGFAALFPLLAGLDKIRDRMAPNAPLTLDGMTYMAYSTYGENNQTLDLSADYRAIRWMQANVKGSPVIIEGHTTEYRWGTRFTIYTGLPGVVGWNWHQRQQRALTPENWVTSRVDEVDLFYKAMNADQAAQFLKKYNAAYIVVGQMEHAIYGERGLAKFEQMNGKLWDEVYRDGTTVIYSVR
jgi:YYY domain-containing protein